MLQLQRLKLLVEIANEFILIVWFAKKIVFSMAEESGDDGSLMYRYGVCNKAISDVVSRCVCIFCVSSSIFYVLILC